MTARIVTAIASLLLIVLVVLPLGRLAMALAAEPSALSAVFEARNLEATGNTVLLAAAVLAVALTLGVPLGFLFGRTDLPGRDALRVLCALPYAIPPYIAAIAWIALLNPTNGMLNRALGLGLDIYSLPGMALVMGLEATPVVMLATADAFGRTDASLEEQARIAGASRWRALWDVTLPLAAPGLLSAASFVLASAVAAFGVPYLLATGSADPDLVLTTRIAQTLDLDPAGGRPTAVALSLVLLAIGVGLPGIAAVLRGNRRYTVVTGKATRPAPFRLGAAAPLGWAFAFGFAAIGAGVPLIVLIATSLMRTPGHGLEPANLTMANWTTLFARSDVLAALTRSLWLGTAAATAATVLGGLVSWARIRGRARSGISWLGRLPYAIPGTVLALGLVLAWSQEVRFILLERVTLVLALADTLWLLGLAYVVKFLAFPIGNTAAGLEAVDPALEEAARMSGAGFATMLRTITLPLLRPTLVAAWFLVFLAAFTEVTMSVLLSGPDTRVVGTLLFDLQTYGDAPSAAVLAVTVAAIVLAGQGAVRLVGRA